MRGGPVSQPVSQYTYRTPYIYSCTAHGAALPCNRAWVHDEQAQCLQFSVLSVRCGTAAARRSVWARTAGTLVLGTACCRYLADVVWTAPMQAVKLENQGRAQKQERQQHDRCNQHPAASAHDDTDVVLTRVSTAAERGQFAKANAIELLDGVPSPQPLPPQCPTPVEQHPQLPPSCELLDSASPEALLRALALADKLADPALVLLCEAILAARISEVSRCSTFVAMSVQSPGKAARIMARATAVASLSSNHR
eukprot:COSAG06_NODE_2989_length_5984_cov_4.027698_5_plen_253_part_00